MFTVIRRRICLIALLYFIPCVFSLHEYETWEKSLYVAQEPLEGSGKLFVINKFDTVGDGSRFERKKREAPTTPAPALEKNISTWVMHRFLINYRESLSPLLFCLYVASVVTTIYFIFNYKCLLTFRRYVVPFLLFLIHND